MNTWYANFRSVIFAMWLPSECGPRLCPYNGLAESTFSVRLELLLPLTVEHVYTMIMEDRSHAWADAVTLTRARRRLPAALLGNALMRIAGGASAVLVGLYLADLTNRGARVTAALVGPLEQYLSAPNFSLVFLRECCPMQLPHGRS